MRLSLFSSVQSTRAPALDPPFVTAVEDQAAAFLAKLESILENANRTQSPWIFGTDKPTALDAHLLPFLARLVDVGRERMLGDGLRAYAENVFNMEIWKLFMQGRRTVYSTYL